MPFRAASGTIEWSIIIPAHNEAARILPFLRSITSYMQDRGQPYEVLVVDDGSTDATASVVETVAASVPEIQLLQTPSRRGKGAAVRRGMQSAVGHLQLFADADGATPIQELARLEQALVSGADLAIGSRSLASRLPDYAVQARLHRTILGNLFNSVVQQ
ncbi:MAG: glycosyltransferase, partial [Nitrospirae bacterium]|nr:glycosyltransferase [Nitrospirota bacterium]